MEVLLRRRCCVWCNSEADYSSITPPQVWATWRWPIAWKTLNFYFFIACLVLVHGSRNRPQLLTIAYSRALTWVVEALLTTSVEGLEVCWLHLILWKKCCGSSFLIIPLCWSCMIKWPFIIPEVVLDITWVCHVILNIS